MGTPLGERQGRTGEGRGEKGRGQVLGVESEGELAGVGRWDQWVSRPIHFIEDRGRVIYIGWSVEGRVSAGRGLRNPAVFHPPATEQEFPPEIGSIPRLSLLRAQHFALSNPPSAPPPPLPPACAQKHSHRLRGFAEGAKFQSGKSLRPGSELRHGFRHPLGLPGLPR